MTELERELGLFNDSKTGRFHANIAMKEKDIQSEDESPYHLKERESYIILNHAIQQAMQQAIETAYYTGFARGDRNGYTAGIKDVRKQMKECDI